MVDPMNPRALYLQLADRIAEMIERGELRAGHPLPGEVRLAQEYGVARGTARLAMAELRRRGLVVTLPARGTFVLAQDERPSSG